MGQVPRAQAHALAGNPLALWASAWWHRRGAVGRTCARLSVDEFGAAGGVDLSLDIPLGLSGARFGLVVLRAADVLRPGQVAQTLEGARFPRTAWAHAPHEPDIQISG